MLRILIADDHPAMRKAIVALISDEFDEVFIGEAVDGLDLIDKALAGEWHLIVSDLYMPGKNGLQALTAIRHEKVNQPFVVISSYSERVYRTPVMDAGANDFIGKDDLSSELIPSIRRIVGDLIS